MVGTMQYRQAIWNHLVENYPEARIAHKSYGRTGWKYATVATYNKEYRVDPAFYNHRTVMDEELVADFDCDASELAKNAQVLISRLEQEGMAYSVWRTNGEEKGGIHVHALFDIPKNVSDKPLLKKLLLEYLVGDLYALGLDTQVLGKHLIRFEGGAYDKQPASVAGCKTLVKSRGDVLKKNRVPESVWKQYQMKVLSWTIKNLRQKRAIDANSDTPKSIQYILSSKFKDHRDGAKRALFVLASYYRKLPDEDLFKMLREFSRYNCKEPVTDWSIKQMVKKAKLPCERPVGERYRKDLLRSIGAYKEVYGEDSEEEKKQVEWEARSESL